MLKNAYRQCLNKTSVKMVISTTISPSMLNTHSIITENDINKTRSKINGGLDHLQTKVIIKHDIALIRPATKLYVIIYLIEPLYDILKLMFHMPSSTLFFYFLG